jgi:hypothetical protein
VKIFPKMFFGNIPFGKPIYLKLLIRLYDI